MILKYLNTIKNFRPTKMNRLGNRGNGGGTYSMGGIRGGGSGGGVVMTFSTNNPSNSLIVSGGDDSGNGYSNKFLWPNM